MKALGLKFWIGFNSFVLLFLAVNICTIGVEVKSRWPFLLGLGYMIYMSVYLSKGAAWKVFALLSIGVCGALFYLLGILFRYTPSSMYPLAGAHMAMSAILAAGAFAHIKSSASLAVSDQ
jgi:hypothetical protein